MPNLPLSVLIHCHCICDDQLAIYKSVKAQRGIPEYRDQIKVSGARTFFLFLFFFSIGEIALPITLSRCSARFGASTLAIYFEFERQTSFSL